MGIIRKTKHFQKVLDVLLKQENAVSANYLVSHFNDEINKSTIYRILNKLEDDGIVHSFVGVNGLKWYAKCLECKVKEHHDNHPHFQCEKCNEVQCINKTNNASKLIGSQFLVKSVLLTGICNRCF